MAEVLKEVSLEEEIKRSYLDYAMSVIIQRALPDACDGLKPVQRRILYGMYKLGLFYNKMPRKSAKIIGEVIANYHPHGTVSVYEALVRLAQDFTMRYTLIDGQGNFGSIDGDPPAAERYTEARLTELAEEMLRDIDKNTVGFIPNYDNTTQEPQVLPSGFPNLLANGCSGIAVGMATSIPPHNLSSLIDSIISFIENPDITIDELLDILKGPDFSTGGIVINKSQIPNIYKTGKGYLIIRGRVKTEISGGRKRIIIYELPYQVNKASLLERIAWLAKIGKLTGIVDLKDFSDKEGIQIMIELRQDADLNITLNQLYKYSQLQITYPVIMLVLVNNMPKICNIKELIDIYVEHRKRVIRRRVEFDLSEARRRYEILEGIKIAVTYLERVIETLKMSVDTNSAKEALKKEFSLTDLQAKAILEMQLQKLTSAETKKLDAQLMKLRGDIEEYEVILSQEGRLHSILKEELLEIKRRFGGERRTDLIDESIDFDSLDLIPEEDVFVLTTTNYGATIVNDSNSISIKKLPYESMLQLLKNNEELSSNEVFNKFIKCSTYDTLGFFTQEGRAYFVEVKDLKEQAKVSKCISKGEILLGSLFKLKSNTKIVDVVPIQRGGTKLLAVTKRGYIKKFEIQQITRSKISCISLNPQDELVRVLVIGDKERDCMLLTKMGFCIRFDVGSLEVLSKQAKGVRGIKLKEEDNIIDACFIKEDSEFIVIGYEDGYIKKTKIQEYRRQKRGGLGLLTGKRTAKTAPLIGMVSVGRDCLILVITDNIIYNLKVEDIPLSRRILRGTRLVERRIKNIICI